MDDWAASLSNGNDPVTRWSLTPHRSSRRIRRRGTEPRSPVTRTSQTVRPCKSTRSMITRPSQLTERDRRNCVALIAEGDAVDGAFVNKWFPRSIVVAVKRSGAEIVGVGVIKPTRRHYAKTVAERSGFELDPDMHEMGYITVREDHQRRGIARDIVKALDSEHEPPLFATTSNESMKRILGEFGFVRRGNGWTGDRGGVLSLWIRDGCGSSA